MVMAHFQEFHLVISSMTTLEQKDSVGEIMIMMEIWIYSLLIVLL